MCLRCSNATCTAFRSVDVAPHSDAQPLRTLLPSRRMQGDVGLDTGFSLALVWGWHHARGLVTDEYDAL